MENYQEIILMDDHYFDSLVKDIESATQSIDMEVYIFSEDEIGERIANAFIAAANRGVKIRLLIDGIGSRTFSTELSNRLRQAGVLIKIYRPLSQLFLHWSYDSLRNSFRQLNSRNHRKTCVIDGKIVYAGSANITAGIIQANAKIKWRDITVKLIGVKLDELQFAFAKAWSKVSMRDNFYYMLRREKDPVLRLNFSWRRRRYFYKDLLKRIDHAQKRICITNAYFVPKRFLLQRLIQAAKEGVEVCIVLPKNPDVIGMSLLAHSFYAGLLKSGVTIMQHESGILHTKFLMFDDWFCVGSSNFNHRSLLHDMEVDVDVRTPAAKEILEKQFQQYIHESKQVTHADLPQSFWGKIFLKILWRLRWLF